MHGDLYVQWDNKCYRLQKSMYGLKKSLHLWHEKLKEALKRFGLTQLESSRTVFKFKDATHVLIILVYMEDLVNLSPKLSGVIEQKKS